jgi:NAD(P)-dependent dehydrogenase (short-subunit alcohol dehydrogenase family)
MVTHQQKVVIVTGASRGIGAGLVEAFLLRGYNVVANSWNITKTNPFLSSANLALVDGDIGDPNTAASIVDTALSRFGRLDVLVNNAGIFIPKPFTEYTTEDFNTLVSTTLAGFFYVSQLAVKEMLRQKVGNIVSVSTTLAGHAVAGLGAAVQIMVKGGLDAVTRALAMEHVRELQKVIERSVILCETETFSIDDSWLPRQTERFLLAESKELVELPRRFEEEEKNIIEEALKASRGRVFGPAGAAAKLGVHRSTLESKIRSLKIDKNRYKTPN